MPKQIYIDPDLFKVRGALAAPSIPIHAYESALPDERERFGDAGLVQMLRDMMLVREFESCVGSLRAKGSFGGIDCPYKGPAHTSIGQEATSVGQAASLEPCDHIFGHHRSHGEFIAKGVSTIRKLPETSTLDMMEKWRGGTLLRLVEEHFRASDVIRTGENFLLLGLLGELLSRSQGFNNGMGGSMHAFFTPLGIFPNNAIVGASAGLATGAALRMKLARTGAIAVANAGDGATGCGPVWEAINFAAMAQYETLWDEAMQGGLPVLFCFHNNFYAMGSQAIGETTGRDRLSRLAMGINKHAMHAETVDGTNVLAVADAVKRKRELLSQGKGPVLLDLECYRSVGHTTFDPDTYRTNEEIKAWEAHDPILLLSSRLKTAGLTTDDDIATMREDVASQVHTALKIAANSSLMPPVDLAKDPLLIGEITFSNQEIELPTTLAPLLKPVQDLVRSQQDAKKSRYGCAGDGSKLSALRAITYRDALFESILHHMTHDESLVAYGEECREWGGAYGVYRGLAELIPNHRLFTTPIAEASIIATAVGYAMEGGRALVELMYADFLGRAGDEVFNQLAKWQAMSGGVLQLPVVVRCMVGASYGAQHSQDWSGLCAAVPGLKVLYPATPYDAKGLMASALASNDPVVFFEHERLYGRVEQLHMTGVPADYYRIPIGEPDCKRAGSDLTILTVGPSLYAALLAADELQANYQISAEVIDARCLVPFNYDVVLASVKKTKKIVLVSEASERGSFLNTLAANITRLAYSDLSAAPCVLGSPNWLMPGGEMGAMYWPQVHDIVDVVTGELFPSGGRRASSLRRNLAELGRMGL
ncbi:dehydrogenase [Bradyrhizobium sp. C-145]|uniref:alpha-ketoacid dehydrogenase subunit alpha/beta n=1 Tax=Bradyrhizobium sp. C-145 TaxID=574727 RepID=UPI00201B92A8|nr:alpha-ketoacid dehydrogenase subunit alpha/beta [Bradyrhizobium sp. C-145]UQR61453.1 dehydrogenase [Bradyrhizobium sp. C-145]